MIPVSFPEQTAILGQDQPEYEPLPVHRGPRPWVKTTMCFRLSPAELEEIARTRTLWISQLTFGDRFQPVALSTQKPELK